MKDIRRRYNPIVNLSKFTFNKNILSKIVILDKILGDKFVE